MDYMIQYESDLSEQRSKGSEYEIMDGETRFRIALELNWKRIEAK